VSDRRRFEPLDLSGVRRQSIERMSRKVETRDLAGVTEPSAQLRRFLQNLPAILVGREFPEFLREVVERRKAGQPVLFMYGGHVVKCGLSPLLVDLMDRGYVTALATNGSGAIHDSEMALFGRTSEEVAEGLKDGSFGMVRETGDFLLGVLRECPGEGYGEAIGRRLLELDPAHGRGSLLGAASRLGLPATVHLAIGADIVHQHPDYPAAEAGEATYRDFRILCRVLTGMAGGGVVVNLGSAVVLPEVFLKALTIVRNLGHGVTDLVTANFDMLQHYRPRVNVVDRPTRGGGRGFQFTGHHEIMIPLLHAGLRCFAEIDPVP
jgi:hypothetical protein